MTAMPDYLDRRVDLEDPNLASVLDELSFWSSRFGALLFREIELERGISVLDLACGAGFPLFELAQVLGPSTELVGVDSWGAAIDRAALKLGTYGLKNVRLLQADGARLPLAGDRFDLIVSNLGVNNFENPPAVLAECARVARKDGRLVLTTNIEGHMRELYAIFRELLAELGDPRPLERLAANEGHRGTRISVSSLVEQSGFAVRRIVEESFVARYLDGSALLRHWLTRVGFLDGWRSVVGLADEAVIFAKLESRLNEIARANGELRLTIPMLYLEARRE